jgi:hypothetical protein
MIATEMDCDTYPASCPPDNRNRWGFSAGASQLPPDFSPAVTLYRFLPHLEIVRVLANRRQRELNYPE